MSKTTLTTRDLNGKILTSVFDRTCGLYITDGTIEKDRIAYKEYRKFFDANPHRHTHIFQTRRFQFDVIKQDSDYLQIPWQYVKVTQLSPGIYECYQCYFGRDFAQHIDDAKSDTDIAHILLQMQLCQGIGKEMEEFLDQVDKNTNKALEASTNSKDKTVN
jgi:hypothetical protein